ncbi:family with sequence similarity 71 member E1 [Rhinolophus ferrumequinum]|uniref:Family with sequence similarity 71 member E1 n=1 Tax=Rhinolophus ferrumequinum TaxID=59479 RepID=A0A7J7SHY2_RHIFE|nr:family with sequence similarity 71 member E1 [Rhinolophus ferrumequinum]
MDTCSSLGCSPCSSSSSSSTTKAAGSSSPGFRALHAGVPGAGLGGAGRRRGSDPGGGGGGGARAGLRGQRRRRVGRGWVRLLGLRGEGRRPGLWVQKGFAVCVQRTTGPEHKAASSGLPYASLRWLQFPHWPSPAPACLHSGIWGGNAWALKLEVHQARGPVPCQAWGGEGCLSLKVVALEPVGPLPLETRSSCLPNKYKVPPPAPELGYISSQGL